MAEAPFADDDPLLLYVRYTADAGTRIRQQEFALDRLPVREREAGGVVMTSKRIDYVGAVKPAGWNDSLTGLRGRLSHLA